MKYVIIGSGVAGIAAIEAIRSIDASGDIVMVGDDPHGFYSRPGLAYYLTGELHDKTLFPRTANDYRRMNFRYTKGSATGIQRDPHTLVMDGQPQIFYDRLLIAVGAQALPLEIPGASLEGVVKLDHLEDAKRILRHARRGRTAVVLGGGITALELVEGLLSRGVKVHYLLRGDRYWSNVLDEQESKIVEHRL
ncbi:MAG TPA: NAD(P)/FAD-dependent oxidoreductase, partial [Anaerolineales bacterium]|nr:NAD(P)/FAD-dependent oxidoreductase [Anaerolineales bacterium]